MEIVHIVLDKKLLQAADQAAKLTRQSRSALVRDALREHLLRLELNAREKRDRQGSRSSHKPTPKVGNWRPRGRRTSHRNDCQG